MRWEVEDGNVHRGTRRFRGRSRTFPGGLGSDLADGRAWIGDRVLLVIQYHLFHEEI